ncbi:MAG: response regulator [Ruminococcaceae bacterium]|nr:response regulator [Oscillospiraceae bacterium]
MFLNGTALFVVIRTVCGGVLQRGLHYTVAGNEIYLAEVAVSVAALAVIGVLFICAKPFLQRFHTVLALALLAGVAVIAAVCLPHVRLGTMTGGFGLNGLHPSYVVFSIVLLAPWAFVGFDVISMETAHFAFPVGRSKRIMASAILLSGLVYAALSLVSVAAVPDGYGSWGAYFDRLDDAFGVASVPTFYAAQAIMGRPGLILMGVTALAAILTGMIGACRATTRVLSTMAEDRILSEKFSATKHSILFIMGISIVIAFLGRNALNWFVELTSFGAIVGFGYTSAAAYRLARAEENRRVALTGLIGTVITVAFAIVQLVPRLAAIEAMSAASFLLLSLWCLLGFVFYWRTVTHRALSEYSGISTSGVVLFALLLYAILMWLGKLLSGSGTVEAARAILGRDGVVLLIVVFVGLAVMLYIQNLVRRRHEELEREKIRAVESNLAKSRFLFNMSHDIRTPMNAIIGYTNLALQENESPEIGRYLTKIDTSSKHLLTLINDVLEMSRIESGKSELTYEPTDRCGVFDEVRDIFAQQMRDKELDFSAQTSQVRHRYVWCDRKSVSRVLLNIVGNAYKFTPAGGTIAASVWEIGTGERDRGSYEIRVQDSGIGMSREFVEKMFRAFERERTSTVSGIEGTGLGLAITKSLVDLMDGTIEVITSPGAGTEFIIRLAFQLAEEREVYEAARQETSADTAPAEPDFTGRRLLLVEDNEINREIATMLLSQAGFVLETAENGREAVDKVAASTPGYYDAILMDIQMPVMDGYEATRAIRALDDRALAAVPIVALTANAFKEDEQAAMESGMQAHIAKPLDMDKMLQTLAAVLADGAGKDVE